MEIQEYEKKHLEYLRKNASECCLFLNRDDSFPLDGPCKIALVGNGARNTVKGGTGSGDVASRFYKTIEMALETEGFEIVSKDWMDKYDAFRKTTRKEFVKRVKKEAKAAGILPMIYCLGCNEEEKNYDIKAEYDTDTCIYVLSRNQGEGNDRRNVKGDIGLSDKEVEDILYLNKKHKKFLLVLNIGGYVDLTPIKEVSNILLLSQLGAVTGDVFADILLGRVNPSGKLTSTWAKPEDYPFFGEFGDMNDTYYKEGIYVGYRYFETFNKDVTYPFGYGKSYTDFEYEIIGNEVSGSILKTDVKVTNIGRYAGKEVIQAYLTKPSIVVDCPKLELAGFKKTSIIEPSKSEIIRIEVDLLDNWCFDEKSESKILEKGSYVLSAGNSSKNLKKAMVVKLSNTVTVEKLKNLFKECGFEDLKPSVERTEEDGTISFNIDLSNHETRVVEYKKDEYKDDLIASLSDDDLIKMCVGNHGSGFAAMVGASCEDVVGGAGQTNLKIENVKKSLTMADGPAGLRLNPEYGVDEKGVYNVRMDLIMESMMDFMPVVARPFLKPPKNRHGEIHYQYSTAIPIGTALAQSFNPEFIEGCGKIVFEEMEMFNVDLWLAPALNIQRNILCGRNFEYYSEDPYVSGITASSIVKGSQDERRGATIKHFCANNQEANRTNSNSHVSERALREIYLKGFEICIKKSNPHAIMTSYNLLNGTHTSEHYGLINDLLRCEWKYDGLVMTDWVQSGRSFSSKAAYPSCFASNNVLAGNDLTMPGADADEEDMKKALQSGKITRDDLVHSASRIYRSITSLKK